MVSSADFPTIHIISDSIGETASAVAQAAAAQFGVLSPDIDILSKAKTLDQVKRYLEKKCDSLCKDDVSCRLLVFYTLVDINLRDQVSAYIDSHPGIYGVDLLTSAIDAIADMTGLIPDASPGALRIADGNYFKRVDAINFTIAHDDGKNPQDLYKADIVLVGASRTCKTPLSIYISQHGFRVANVPLDMKTAPPKELELVDKTRLYGLMSTPEVLEKVRSKRIAGMKQVTPGYADLEYIYEDLESAHEIMRKLGCYIIRTDGRGIEEASQEILSHYLKYHDMPSDIEIQ